MLALFFLSIKIFVYSFNPELKRVTSFQTGKSVALLPEATIPPTGVNTHLHALETSQVEHWQGVSIIISDLGFFPQTIVVRKGIPVRLYITSIKKDGPLCFVAEDLNIMAQISHGSIEEFPFTVQQEKIIKFNCPINGKTGTLIVR